MRYDIYIYIYIYVIRRLKVKPTNCQVQVREHTLQQPASSDDARFFQQLRTALFILYCTALWFLRFGLDVLLGHEPHFLLPVQRFGNSVFRFRHIASVYCFLTLFQQPAALSGTITNLENHIFNVLYAYFLVWSV